MKIFIDGTFGFPQKWYRKLKTLSTPKKIQDFIDTFSINHEEMGETYMSVERTLKAKKAHCLEGALVAALALWIQGEKPLLLDLKSSNGDDHIVTLYRKNGYWGAISKTNHATLRFRDPVYQTIRELALSYFHEYIHLKTGEKILESFSEPFNLSTYNLNWIRGKEELFNLAEALDSSPHHRIYPKKNTEFLRKADSMEMKAGAFLEWN
jgi:hypothetical protein